MLGFLEAPAEQRDYSAINDALAQMDAMGKCVYRKHGHPCPAGLDVAQSGRMQEILSYFGA